MSALIIPPSAPAPPAPAANNPPAPDDRSGQPAFKDVFEGALHETRSAPEDDAPAAPEGLAEAEALTQATQASQSAQNALAAMAALLAPAPIVAAAPVLTAPSLPANLPAAPVLQAAPQAAPETLSAAPALAEAAPLNAGKTPSARPTPSLVTQETLRPAENAGLGLAPVTAQPVFQIIEPARLAEARTSGPQLMAQLTGSLEHMLRSGETTLRLQLHPESLGRIDLQLTSGPEGVRVNFAADQAATQVLLERHLDDLRRSLSESGLQLTALSVSVGQGQDAPDWQRPRQPDYRLLAVPVTADVAALVGPVGLEGGAQIDCRA